MDFIISTQDKYRKEITKQAIKEICYFLSVESSNIYETENNKDENGVFKLPDGRQGFILTQSNNTLPGKIKQIKKILKETGDCLIYIPKIFRDTNTVIRFAKLLTNAYDNISILDSNWISKKTEFSIPYGEYWNTIYRIDTTNKLTTIQPINTNTFYNYQEAGLLALYFSKKRNHKVIIKGNINRQYISPEFQEEWNNNNITNLIKHNHKEHTSNNKTTTNINQEHKIQGSLDSESIPEKDNSKSKSASRKFDNQHQVLAIAFSNYLRSNSIPTAREFLDIDIVSWEKSKIKNIYEVKTAISEIYKGIGQLLSYQFKVEKRFSNLPQMNLVLPFDLEVGEQQLEILKKLDIICVHFCPEKGIIKSN